MYTKVAIAFLFGAFLLQPIAPVYANGSTTTSDSAVDSAEVTEDVEEEDVSVDEDESDAPEQMEEPNEDDDSPTEESTDVQKEPNAQATEGATSVETDDPTADEDAAEAVTDDDEGTESQRDITAPDTSSTESTPDNLSGEHGSSDTASSTTNTETASAGATTTATTSDEVVDDVPATTTPDSDGVTSGSDGTDDELDVVSASSSDPSAPSTASTTDTATTTDESTTGQQIDAEVAGTSTSTDEVSETEEESTTDTVDTTVTPPSTDAENDENEDVEGGVLEDTATSTEESEPLEATASVTNDQNRYQFGESECVSVGDGSFYCSKDTGDSRLERENTVYAEQDEDGDQEIFFNADGEVIQLTDNGYEDASPYLDLATGDVVFHRLVSGRYQIILVDGDTREEKQLTNTRTNNMEPVKEGDIIVWQQWVNGDWEIAADIDGERTLLTNNDHHDVAPSIRDGYIMWHTTNSDGEKLLSVYEIASGVSSTVADPDGGHVENPRFVLVYDTKFENGDTVTKEYDPETGEVRPIGSEPAPVPVDIPAPEPAGETRALIQNKSTSTKDELVNLDDGTNTTASSSPDVSTSTSGAATSTSDIEVEDVDMRASSTEPLELTEFDVVVEPAATSSAQEVDTTGATTTVQ